MKSKTKKIEIRVTPEQKAAFQAAAERAIPEPITLSEWVRRALIVASTQCTKGEENRR